MASINYYYIILLFITFNLDTRVRVRTEKRRKKKKACPARVAKAGQENIRTVHEPKPIQTADTLCMDKVAVLWRVPTAHNPRR
jgi:hypothetical protein